jgi:hypothetical protein
LADAIRPPAGSRLINVRTRKTTPATGSQQTESAAAPIAQVAAAYWGRSGDRLAGGPSSGRGGRYFLHKLTRRRALAALVPIGRLGRIGARRDDPTAS